ncbi:MAG: hypothetical protein ACI8UO_003148 [Verrucomicrobiales bacterium]
MEQDAELMISQAETDALPGFSAEKATAAADALGAWKKADEKQDELTTKQSEATAAFEKAVEEANSGRRSIQLAADALWPWDGEGNGPVRKAFALPEGRPMNV